MKDVLQKAPETGARFEENTEVARMVETLATIYHRIDVDIGQMREDRYIETATGRELDRRATPLGAERPTGESDDVFRRRALAARARSTSTTTFEDFADAVLTTLDAEPSDVELKVDYVDELGAVIVRADSSVLDESPFSESEIKNLLDGAVPAGRRVVLRKTDGFQFSDPGTTGSKSGKGFGQGQWTA